ncbi:hypothetical protein FHS16_001872 [Paenibacillus endophyticus]|uniref:Xylose isomerase-like TIM barrel domain-containing protein n=1 Tax=Paenibacillus endophyticus TaxID=1294268 RepID=A0A7W5G9N2_9BACL|nr:TIM barrel protein [Paenibacillus endophyticus]MBB3151826.1 hypothetical protein [Paenibacillus endophyticus]
MPYLSVRNWISSNEQQLERITLLDLPLEASMRGYQAVEICHFHFPSIQTSYLLRLKHAFLDSGISFDTLLLDYGDLSSDDRIKAKADFRYICEWIEIASIAGAKQIRIIAGEALATDKAAMQRVARCLMELDEYAAMLETKVVLENFKTLTSSGDSCLRLLGQTNFQLPFITDFGNFSGKNKYKDLTMTVPFSVSIHAKPQYDENGQLDENDFMQCMEIARSAGYDGSYVLIHEGSGDAWMALEKVKHLVMPFLAPTILEQ